jgi:hypothetical protein
MEQHEVISAAIVATDDLCKYLDKLEGVTPFTFTRSYSVDKKPSITLYVEEGSTWSRGLPLYVIDNGPGGVMEFTIFDDFKQTLNKLMASL